jgi:hypothetical protein
VPIGSRRRNFPVLETLTVATVLESSTAVTVPDKGRNSTALRSATGAGLPPPS